MPGGAFRIGPLPKAGEASPPARPALAPAPARTLTAPRPQGVLAGGASPAFFTGHSDGLGLSIAPGGEPTGPVEAAPSAAAVVAPPPMQVAEVEVVARSRTPPAYLDAFAGPELDAPMFAAPGAGRAPRRLMPTIAAGAVVIGGIAALAVVLLTRPHASQPLVPQSPAVPPPASVASVLSPAPVPAPALAGPAAPMAPAGAPSRLQAAPAVASVQARALARGSAPVAVIRSRSSADAGPPAFASAPVAPPMLVVPPPEPVAAPILAPRSPPPSDPAAPIATRPTNSE
jgi:hypothetical protein